MHLYLYLCIYVCMFFIRRTIEDVSCGRFGVIVECQPADYLYSSQLHKDNLSTVSIAIRRQSCYLDFLPFP